MLVYVEIKSIPVSSTKLKKGDTLSFSEKLICPVSGFSIIEIEPIILVLIMHVLNAMV